MYQTSVRRCGTYFRVPCRAVDALPYSVRMVFCVVAALVFFGGTHLAYIVRRRSSRRTSTGTRMKVTRGQLAAAAAVFFALGTLTWRIRSASDLDSNPVDGAGAIRLAMDVLALAAVIMGISLRSPSRVKSIDIGPLSFYVLYVVVVVVGAFAAIEPTLVLFRAAELGIMLAVAAAVASWCSFRSVLTWLFRAHLLIIPILVLSILVFPGQSLVPTGGIIPFRLGVAFPMMSFNTVGMFGLTLMLLAVGLHHRRIWIFSGVAIIVLAQYRTGYVAVAVVLFVFVCAYSRGRYVPMAAVLLPSFLVFSQSDFFERAWIRGETASQSATTLSGRTGFWSLGLEVWERSPVIGTGLTSGTRYEVFSDLGRGTISTIHGTWVEALVGTGVVGVAALAGFFLFGVRVAVAIRGVSMVPLLLLVATAVRSITGTTIELASIPALTVLIVVASAAKFRRAQTVNSTVKSKSVSDDPASISRTRY